MKSSTCLSYQSKKQKRSLDDSVKAEEEKKIDGRELSSFTNTS